MVEVETKRLKLVALTKEQLEQYLDEPEQLERELGFPLSRAVITPVVYRAIRTKIYRMETTGEKRRPWYTYWLIIVTDQPYGAGLVGFKGTPNYLREVELGYGIDPDFQNKGYMTEAVAAIIEWAFQTGKVSAVVAETAKTNLASQRVLTKVGMNRYRETIDSLYWRIAKSDGRDGRQTDR